MSLTTNLRDLSVVALAALALASAGPARAKTDLSDEPLLALKAVPGNVALALSVEFPTAVSVAHVDNTYAVATTYIGYFDPAKCYEYKFNATEALRHFAPAGLANNHQCTSPKWSGNFLNWATMQTIDPFRWVLTGGFRVVDTPTETILEKATASGQGGAANFPNRVLESGITAATGTSLSTFKMRIQGLGNKMRFTQGGDVDSGAAATPFDPNATIDTSKVYEVSVRVKVCDPSAQAGGVETFNCVKYPSGNFKPEGLIQRFADKMRLSAFGYLNDPDLSRDGGVLRARQKFVGPTQPVPGKADVVNDSREWDKDTGVFIPNPDAADAASTSSSFGTTISNSGVVNYLNKFGQLGVSKQLADTYKTNDPVSEMYYAAVRYFKKQGNVSEWTDPKGKTGDDGKRLADGFPVITTFDDPIQFSCQKNFILGIGDVNTHADRNVPGATGKSEPTQPGAVSADGTIDAVKATNHIAIMEGLDPALGLTSPYNGCCDNNGALIAGLAYDVHTRDIRSDFAEKQTISTFWMDVLEFQKYKDDNQYYLAAKYGGFTVPNGFNPASTTPLPNELWHTNDQTLGKNLLPDNYFVAANPDQVVGGLTKAFTAIASQITAFGTAFSVVQPQVARTGTASYSGSFDWGLRQGEVTASELTFSADGVPSLLTPPRWQFSQKLRTQLSDKDGFSSKRRVVTFDPDARKGVPFRHDKLTTLQREALNTAFVPGDDSADVVNYLRGDQTNEQGRTQPSRRIYRTRQSLVGDIVGSKVVPVQAPSAPYSDFFNPGYNAFRQANKTRPVVVYFGGNDGMLHALRGDLGAGGGEELFAFVPNAVIAGPDNTPGVNGLAALADPAFAAKGEYFFVNGTPRVFDVDFNRTDKATSKGPDWHSVLVGGLGKGGRSYYAIDVTDPLAMTTEATAAAKVLWEFTDPDGDLGFTFGDPIVAKTAKYGWVVILTSGHNNASGRGFFYFLNPRTGELLEKVATGVGTQDSPAGMTQATALVLNRTDGTIDAVYAGDLLGNLWRVDVTSTSGTYEATKLAVFTDADRAGQPVTTRPLVVIQPGTNKRFVAVGTGQLLGKADEGSSQVQAYYVLADGTASRFNRAGSPDKPGDLPADVSFPLTRANFAANTDPLKGVNLAANQLGWFLTLTDKRPDGTASRVVTDSSAFFGRVSFAATLPNNVPCQAAGTSRVFSVDVATGASALVDGDGKPISSVNFNALITELGTFSVNGKNSTVAGLSSGEAKQLNSGPFPPLPLKRINWRELPTVQ